MVELKTPVDTTFSGKVTHTPPSHGKNIPSPTTKFLKKFSGQTLRRFSSKGKSSKISNLDISRPSSPVIKQNNTIGCSDSFTKPIFTFSKPSTSRHVVRNRPSPLELQVITPPVTVRKTNDQSLELGSPIHLSESTLPSSIFENGLGFQSAKRNLQFNLTQRGVSSVYSWDDSEMTPFIDDSPTYFLKKNMSRTAGPKCYISCICSLCEENLKTLLKGEKALELDCEHICHRKCYEAILEMTLLDKQYPICRQCGIISKPKDNELLQNMSAIVLMKIEKEKNWKTKVESSTPFKVDANINFSEFVTPQDQLIKNDDFFQNGFLYSKPKPKTLVSPVLEDLPMLLPHNINTVDPNESISIPRINIIPQLTKISVNDKMDFINIPYVLNVYMANSSDERSNPDLAWHETLREEISTYMISQEIEIHDKTLKNLKMFDKFETSIDGESWEIVNGYMFKDCIIFARIDCVVGKIPVNQLSGFYKFDDSTLIIDLKSSLLPEISLRSSNKIQIDKWLYYLEQFQKVGSNDFHIPLIQQTTSCWGKLPQNILEKIPEDIILFNKLTEHGLDLPQKLLNQIVPFKRKFTIQVIICISIVNCHPELHSNDELRIIIQNKLRSLKYSLDEDDLLGLIIVGRNGAGDIGDWGTFYGMVDKKWELWDDIIDDITVVDNNKIFSNEVHEIKQMLQTCNKLLLTTDHHEKMIKQLIIVGNDHKEYEPFNIDEEVPRHEIEDLINIFLHDYKLSITQYVTSNNNFYLYEVVRIFNYSVSTISVETLKDVNISETIKNIHSKSIKDLEITLSSFNSKAASFQFIEKYGELFTTNQSDITVKIGDLEPGEYRNILFEMKIDARLLIGIIEDMTSFLSLDQYLSKSGSNSLSIVSFQSYWNNSKCSKSGESIKVDFKIHQSSSSPTSNHIMFSLPHRKTRITSIDSDSFMDIPLMPPLTSSRDSINVFRQIECIVIGVLKKMRKENPATWSLTTDEMASILYGLSRECSCLIPSFYREVGLHKSLTEYTQVLCDKIDYLVSLPSVKNQSYYKSYINGLICELI